MEPWRPPQLLPLAVVLFLGPLAGGRCFPGRGPPDCESPPTGCAVSSGSCWSHSHAKLMFTVEVAELCCDSGIQAMICRLRGCETQWREIGSLPCGQEAKRRSLRLPGHAPCSCQPCAHVAPSRRHVSSREAVGFTPGLNPKGLEA